MLVASWTLAWTQNKASPRCRVWLSSVSVVAVVFHGSAEVDTSLGKVPVASGDF